MAIWRRVTTTIAERGGRAGHDALPGGERERLVRRSGGLTRWLEYLLLAVAVLCLGYVAYVPAAARLYQAHENRELNAILRSGPAPAPAPDAAGALRPRRRPAAGESMGRLEIPRLGVSAIVRAGSDARTLRLAVGHIPGTALPGEAGNVGLAAHRDTFFRRLEEIRRDDEIRIVTAGGVYRYRVERTNVVEPEDVRVLDPTDTPSLTLVTCYPFGYLGAAPQRFIVRARDIGASS